MMNAHWVLFLLVMVLGLTVIKAVEGGGDVSVMKVTVDSVTYSCDSNEQEVQHEPANTEEG